jgi:hypothetical protein
MMLSESQNYSLWLLWIEQGHPGKLHSHTMYCLGCDLLHCTLEIGRDLSGSFWSCCGQQRNSSCTVSAGGREICKLYHLS